MATRQMSITDKVVDMYTQYPYPLKGNHGDFFFKWVYPKIISQEKKIDRVLDAGCGTGNVSFDLARAFPNAEIVAVDITDRSLEIAKNKLAKSNFKNITFKKLNLLKYEEKLGKFDFVHSQGVVHHLADPFTGLKNLSMYMSEDSILYFWVYTALGRMKITEIKEIFSWMGLNQLPFDEQLQMIEKIEKGFPLLGKCGGLTRDPAANLSKRKRFKYVIMNRLITALTILRDDGPALLGKMIFQQLIPKSGKRDGKNADEGYQVGMVDTYLNVNEQFFRYAEIEKLIDSLNLKLCTIVQGMSDDIQTAFADQPEILGIVSKLPRTNQYALIELLEKPSGLGFLCTHDR